MITCVVDYVIDSKQIEAFEKFARRWIDLVNRYGGRHHGYFLPSEGASDRALALFSFGCVLRYERSFMRPLLERDQPVTTSMPG